ncbi:MAG: homoserine kinase [Gammaproteobacteria bacterium]|nr:homoserine kinase [Gammaproteobacteria bacterium]MYC53295.1 homoserine kinase [Gammaproteobacteria bacterium]
MTGTHSPGGAAAVRVSAPATIGNIACGFDVFGLAIARPSDAVVARAKAEPGVTIERIRGDVGPIPADSARNSAGAAARAVVEMTGARSAGLALELHKGIPLAGGMGGSASSAVVGAVAADRVIGAGLSRRQLLQCAVAGELAGSGSPAADNVAPALYGGIVLVLPGKSLQVVELPVPAELWAVVVRPHLETRTEDARRVLGEHVPLKAAVTQWANTAAFTAGLYASDWDLISRSIRDVVAEPLRAGRIPGFARAREAALAAGALGFSLSGSGPSVFALCRGGEAAQHVAAGIRRAFGESAALDCEAWASPVNRHGVRVEDVEPEGD